MVAVINWLNRNSVWILLGVGAVMIIATIVFGVAVVVKGK
jgi:hypothetical protein